MYNIDYRKKVDFGTLRLYNKRHLREHKKQLFKPGEITIVKFYDFLKKALPDLFNRFGFSCFAYIEINNRFTCLNEVKTMQAPHRRSAV